MIAVQTNTIRSANHIYFGRNDPVLKNNLICDGSFLNAPIWHNADCYLIWICGCAALHNNLVLGREFTAEPRDQMALSWMVSFIVVDMCIEQ